MKARTFAIAVCWVASTVPTPAYELPSLLDVPYPTELTAAAAADRIAWISNERGARNVWIASAPSFTPQALTHSTADDGQELSSLQLSRDGSVATWVRGGNPDAAGFSQNPQSVPGGVEQEIWVATDGTARKLAAGRSPVLSPDGRVVAFIRDGTVQCQVVASGATAPQWCTTPLLKLRGSNQRPVFSPDGSRIAFVSDRGDHSFIGIFNTATRAVTWLAPEADRDDLPAWSPDGRSVAFIRIAGARFGELLNITGAWPFEIWVADAQTGAGHRVWRSGDTAGGFAQIDLEGPARAPLSWTAGNQLLFYSEESGWLHLYALSPEGGQPRDLTPGQCEVESHGLSADGRSVIVSGNCAEIDGRQLFRVSVAGGKPERLAGATIDVGPVFIGTSQRYAYRSADAIQPTAVAIASGSGAPKRIFPAALPATFPARDLVNPEVVTFKAADGLTIHGQLFRPAHAAGKRPAAIFVHGGPVRQMLPGWHYMDYYRNSYGMNQYLASRGFVVLSINYRDGIGYGQAFRRAANQGPRGASEYQDVVAGHDFLAHRADVDPAHIGIWGGSYGGLLTAQALARNSDLFAAGVDFHGVHDWAQFGKDYHGGGWALDESTFNQAHESSPDAAVEQWRSPVLLIHGDDDRSVPFNQTVDLLQRLRAQHVHVETLILPDEEHDFLRYESWRRAYAATAEFLERTLAAPKADR
ncbi:MAG: S9 family peptidase [Proteobacteria bacterium]|nr:S9 family peptidase [Pseudomonadota bacterium]